MNNVFKKAIEINHNAIIVTDENANILYVNPAFTELTGYTEEEVLGKNPRILQSGEHSKEFYEDMWKTLTAGETWSGEFHNKSKDGEDFWEFAVISRVESEGKTYYVAAKENITKIKNLEAKLVCLYNKAEKINGYVTNSF